MKSKHSSADKENFVSKFMDGAKDVALLTFKKKAAAGIALGLPVVHDAFQGVLFSPIGAADLALSAGVVYSAFALFSTTFYLQYPKPYSHLIETPKKLGATRKLGGAMAGIALIAAFSTAASASAGYLFGSDDLKKYGPKKKYEIQIMPTFNTSAARHKAPELKVAKPQIKAKSLSI